MAAHIENGAAISLFTILVLFFVVCLTGNCSAQITHHDRDDAGKMDTASLTVFNELENKIQILLQSTECHTCNLLPVRNISSRKNHTLIVDTRWPIRLAVNYPDNFTEMYTFQYCAEDNLSRHFQEHGQYKLWVSKNNTKSGVICTGPIILNDPLDSNVPIYAAIAILAVLSASWILIKYLHRNHYLYKLFCCFGTERLLDPDLGIPPSINPGDEGGGGDSPDKSKSSSRLRSLDTFRGISITIMVFVNYGGGGYWFFRHSKWNGLTVADLVFPCLCLTLMILANYGGGGYWFLDHSVWNGLTVADLVFPWFVFIMGTALAISLRSQLRKATSKRQICFRIIKRSIILFILGLLTNTGPKNDDLATLRIPGVLQRFSITYLVVALIHLVCARGSDSSQYNWVGRIRDLTDYWQEWIPQFIFIGTYLGLTFGLNVPGCPKGYLGPGGLSEGGNYSNCTGGAAGYIDRWIFSDKHIYHHPTCKEVYATGPYDPEGTLGTLNSILMCFLGLQAGKIILIFNDYAQRIKRFMVWSVLLMAIAAVLCKVSKDDGWIPVNKNLWSLSFVLLLSGFAFSLLTVCYMSIDVWKIWSGAPFFYPGMNSILVYISHLVFATYFPVQISDLPDQHWGQLLIDLYGVSFWVLVAFVLYTKKLFFAI